MTYSPGRHGKATSLVITLALVGLAASPAVSQTSGAAAASAAGETICPALPAEDPDVAGLRENQLDPEGAPKFKAALAKFFAKGPAMMKEWKERNERDWAYLCRYRADNQRVLASGTRPDTIFIGDSITENWIHADPALFARNILDRGISGQLSGQILLRFYQDVVALHPRVVHLMAGTNDLGQEGNAAFSDDDIVHNMTAMIDMAKSNGIRVVLASIPPVKSFFTAPQAHPAQRVLRLNERLRKLAKDRGAVYVDYHGALAGTDGAMRPNLTSDGVHPNRVAYQIMRPLAERAIGQARR